jgi:dTDP-4-dehydrorhamnose 3,5-epimerase-like enzyme
MTSSKSAAERYELFDLDRIDDPSGKLYVAELAERGGGSFKRIYFIIDVPHGRSRGGHAHKQQSEYLIVVQGSVEVHVEGHGSRDVVALDRPGRALYLPRGYWRDLVSFSDDAVIAVLASDSFDESDYIRDRGAFDRWEREQKT